MDRRVKKTKTAIKQALITLLKQTKFDEITVTKLTQIADVSRKTFYDHYTDKYELIDELSAEYLQELNEVSHGPKDISTKERLVLWLSYIKEHQTIFQQLIVNDSSYLFQDKFLKYLDNSLKHNSKIKEDNTNYAFLSYGILGVVEGFVAGRIQDSPAVVAQKINALTDGKLG